MAQIDIDTPYFTGRSVEAMVMKSPVYDLVVGNIPGARKADDPIKDWQPQVTRDFDQTANVVMTRAGVIRASKPLKPLNVTQSNVSNVVNVKNLVQLQKDDKSLDKIRNLTDKRKRGKNVHWFSHEGDILYRYFQSPLVNGGKVLRQVVVPKSLRTQVMTIAHDGILAGHMGIQKTKNRIQLCFYWPGIEGDVTRYCKSCDVCQRTIPKGKVMKVPLGEMPLIETAFKRIAIDLVGPISPVSERGFRYILTIVDYATRYPEAVPLKQISTEDVAEALVSVYSRVGFPEEVLSDKGAQFTSSVMNEVNRILSIQSAMA
jgi:hypothetical protein